MFWNMVSTALHLFNSSIQQILRSDRQAQRTGMRLPKEQSRHVWQIEGESSKSLRECQASHETLFWQRSETPYDGIHAKHGGFSDIWTHFKNLRPWVSMIVAFLVILWSAENSWRMICDSGRIQTGGGLSLLRLCWNQMSIILARIFTAIPPLQAE